MVAIIISLHRELEVTTRAFWMMGVTKTIEEVWA